MLSFFPKDYPLYEGVHFENLRDVVEIPARLHPDKIALSWKENPREEEVERMSYGDLRDLIRILGTGMRARGMAGEHVALLGETSVEWISSYLALFGIGAVVVPLDLELTAEEIKELIKHSESRFVLFGDKVSDKVEKIQEELPEVEAWFSMGKKQDKKGWQELVLGGQKLWKDGDHSFLEYEIDTKACACIVFTSGTTGKGKGVMLSQENLASNMVNAMPLFQVSEKTVLLLPLHHTYGATVNLIGHLVQGCEIFLCSGLRYMMKEIQAEKPGHLILVPVFLEKIHSQIMKKFEKTGKASIYKGIMRFTRRVLHLGVDVREKLFGEIKEALGGKLDMIICGGAALRQDIIDDFEAFGITIMNGYGVTECSPLISCNRNEYRKPGSVGRPILDLEVKIDCEPGQSEGEICVRGSNVMLGYWNNPEASAEVLDEEGYFHTGDIGYLDEEGWIYISGRKKNLILFSNGKNVYPEELEAKIAQLPGVGEVMVYAGKSRTQQDKEIIVAEIFPDQEALDQLGVAEAQAFLEEQVHLLNEELSVWKRIGMIKIRHEEFPKNSSRKIKRYAVERWIA